MWQREDAQVVQAVERTGEKIVPQDEQVFRSPGRGSAWVASPASTTWFATPSSLSAELERAEQYEPSTPQGGRVQGSRPLALDVPVHDYEIRQMLAKQAKSTHNSRDAEVISSRVRSTRLGHVTRACRVQRLDTSQALPHAACQEAVPQAPPGASQVAPQSPEQRYMQPRASSRGEFRDRFGGWSARTGSPAKPTHRKDTSMPILTETQALWMEVLDNSSGPSPYTDVVVYAEPDSSYRGGVGLPPRRQLQLAAERQAQLLTERQRELEIERLRKLQKQRRNFFDREARKMTPAERKQARARLQAHTASSRPHQEPRVFY